MPRCNSTLQRVVEDLEDTNRKKIYIKRQLKAGMVKGTYARSNKSIVKEKCSIIQICFC